MQVTGKLRTLSNDRDVDLGLWKDGIVRLESEELHSNDNHKWAQKNCPTWTKSCFIPGHEKRSESPVKHFVSLSSRRTYDVNCRLQILKHIHAAVKALHLRVHDLAHDDLCSPGIHSEDRGADVHHEYRAILLVDVKNAGLRYKSHRLEWVLLRRIRPRKMLVR